MDLAQLEMLVATVEAGGVQKAARLVCRTQPAVSMALRKLEEEVGAALFDRANRGAYMLTETGELLYESARKLLRLRDETLAEVRGLHRLQRGRLRIGANESTSTYLLPKLIRTFHDKFPHIKVETVSQPSSRLVQEVKERTVDVAFISFAPEDDQIDVLPVKSDELILIVHPEHVLAARKVVTLRDLGRETFIANSARSRSREKVVEVFRENGVPLNISMEISSAETIRKLVRMNLGIAFVPHMCVEEDIRLGDIVRIRVEGFSHPRTVWLARRRSDVHSHASDEFTKTVTTMSHERKSGSSRR